MKERSSVQWRSKALVGSTVNYCPRLREPKFEARKGWEQGWRFGDGAMGLRKRC